MKKIPSKARRLKQQKLNDKEINNKRDMKIYSSVTDNQRVCIFIKYICPSSHYPPYNLTLPPSHKLLKMFKDTQRLVGLTRALRWVAEIINRQIAVGILQILKNCNIT